MCDFQISERWMIGILNCWDKTASYFITLMLLPDLIPAFSNTINSLNMSVGNNMTLFYFPLQGSWTIFSYRNVPITHMPIVPHTLWSYSVDIQFGCTQSFLLLQEPLRAKFRTNVSRQISADINGTALPSAGSEFRPLPKNLTNADGSQKETFHVKNT